MSSACYPDFNCNLNVNLQTSDNWLRTLANYLPSFSLLHFLCVIAMNILCKSQMFLFTVHCDVRGESPDGPDDGVK